MGGLSCQPWRQDRAGNPQSGASCGATQKLHNLNSEGNRQPVFSRHQKPHTRGPPFRAQGPLHRETGKCVWVTWQTPMHPSKPTDRPAQMPPPALTSVRDDLIFFLAWLSLATCQLPWAE